MSAPPRVTTREPQRRLSTRRGGRDRLWSAIRILKRFDMPSLMMASEQKLCTAQAYVYALMRAGILRYSAQPTRSCPPVFMLAGPVGPKTPILREFSKNGTRFREVFDPNSGKTFDITPGRSVAPSKSGGVS